MNPSRQKILAIAIILSLSTIAFYALGKNYRNIPKNPNKTISVLPGVSQSNDRIDNISKKKLSPDIPQPLIINQVLTDKKIIALSFDADMTYGMEYSLKNGVVKSWYSKKVIEELIKTQTPATLFLTGLWVKNYPEATKELAANPLFEIANHSYSHPAFALPCYGLRAIPNDSDEQEIIRTENLLKLYAPNYKKYFRFPGLCYDKFDIAAVEKQGYKIIHGDVIGGDGFTQNTAGIVSRVVSRTKPGSIIILHMHGAPNAPKTAEALPEIIRQLKEKGYSFVKVSELLAQN